MEFRGDTEDLENLGALLQHQPQLINGSESTKCMDLVERGAQPFPLKVVSSVPSPADAPFSLWIWRTLNYTHIDTK